MLQLRTRAVFAAFAAAGLAGASLSGAALAETKPKPKAKPAPKAEKVIRIDAQAGNKIKLKPGDIVLYMDRGYFSGVATGQGISRLNPVIAYKTSKGSIYTHHAAVIAEKPDSRPNRPKGATRLGLAHSVGVEGVSFKGIDDETGIKVKPDVYYSYLVFRLKHSETQAQWAKKVVKVAKLWTTPGKGGEYADFTALLSPAFHSSSYGDHAKKRMKVFEKAAATEGGPSGEKFFCSQLVIAIFQGAMGKYSAKFMALDADYTSPMKLHAYLAENKEWRFLGEERYEAPKEKKDNENTKDVKQAKEDKDVKVKKLPKSE